MSKWSVIWIIVLIALLTWGYIKTHPGPENSPEEPLQLLATIQNNSLASISPVYVPPTIVYGSLINCLIKYESGGRIDAIGKANEKGILQFKDTTFQQYCVEKYELGKNIWNPYTQQVCCDRMLQDNFSNIQHWTTAEFCL